MSISLNCFWDKTLTLSVAFSLLMSADNAAISGEAKDLFDTLAENAKNNAPANGAAAGSLTAAASKCDAKEITDAIQDGFDYPGDKSHGCKGDPLCECCNSLATGMKVFKPTPELIAEFIPLIDAETSARLRCPIEETEAVKAALKQLREHKINFFPKLRDICNTFFMFNGQACKKAGISIEMFILCLDLVNGKIKKAAVAQQAANPPAAGK